MSISTVLITTLIEAVNLAGVETPRFLRKADLPSDFLTNTPKRISLEQYDKAQTAAIELSEDTALGLHMGEMVSLSSLSVVGNLLLNCSGLKEAFEVFNRYHHIISECPPSTLEILNNQAVISYEYPRSTPLCNRLRSEYGIVSLKRLAHSLLNDQLHAIEIRFEHNKPQYVGEYERIFHSDIQFSCEKTQIIFPEAYLHKHFSQPNPELYHLLKKQAEQLLLKLHGASLASQIQSLIEDQYQGIKPQIRQVASHFNVSARTLRRHLQEEGINFTSIVEKTQADIARILLSDPKVSIKSIAYQLGFEEPGSFTRAFKRWTGKTPLEYREKLI